MKMRWQSWLLPLLAVGLLTSVFEVNTDNIGNTWGDAYDTYLLPSFSVDTNPSSTVSSRQRIRSLPSEIRQFLDCPAVVFRPASLSNRLVFLHRTRIHLRCCQWLI